MTSMEITRLVNRYIGVSGGYLGDFSYRTHADFYPEYCDLDIKPHEYEGATRERFIQILSSLRASDQAKVIRGVIERFPVEASNAPPTRTPAARDSLLELAARLERQPGVLPPAPQMTSDVVDRALRDAETLIQTSGPTSAVDRVHTALHGYLALQCRTAGITYQESDGMPALLRKLRRDHTRLGDLGPRADDLTRVLNASGAILEALLALRNRASVAHPNEELLGDDEARLVINVGRSLLTYLDAKLAAE
jgi:hypothetical protein